MSHLIRSVISTAAMLILVACLSPTALGSPALSGIPWHESLDKAREASAISKRPVLAVFGASWSQASVSLHEKTLVDSEVVAILTACFEPVRIDVDEDPAITRRLGVTYLPSACVIDANDRVLTKFDCPAAPASFIAAAGRAVQAAASTAAQPAVTAVATTPPPAVSAFPAAEETKTIPATVPAAEIGRAHV